MSVAMSSSSLYGRRGALAKKLQGEILPILPKNQPAERGVTTSSEVTSTLQSRIKTGSSASTAIPLSTETRSQHILNSCNSVDRLSESNASLRSGRLKGVFYPYYPFRKGATSRVSSASSVMDEKYRESLQRHYRLLMTHLVLTDDVIKQMAEEKILPVSMIKDIQEAETREEKNECLLKSLHLRGNRSYRRFRELMYRCGNFFVADLLWNEGECNKVLEESELAKFPGLLGCVPETHRRKLLLFLDAKVRERALLLAWKTSPEERMQALSNKVTDFNQEKAFRDTIASQEKKVKDLEVSLEAEKENCRTLSLELASQQQQLQQLRRDHRATLDTQSRFHDANMSTITRLKERLVKCKEEAKELNQAVKRRLETEWESEEERGGKGDEMLEENDFKLGILEKNVRRLLYELNHERERSSRAEEQRQEVLKLLNRRYSKEPLVTVVRDVLKHEQKHRSLVMRDILALAQAFKQLAPGTTGSNSSQAASSTGAPDPSMLDTKHFKAQLAMLKAEAEHIQKRFQWKDSQIAMQQKEILSLSQRLGILPSSPSPTTPAAHSNSGSSSRQSLRQPYTTPIDPSLLQEEQEEEEDGEGVEEQASPASEQFKLGQNSRSSPKPGSNLKTPPSFQRTSFASGQEGGRSPRLGGRSPKTVTFVSKEAADLRGPHHKLRGRSRGSFSAQERVRPDPDKTHVNAERYLLEEVKGQEQEVIIETVEEDFRMRRRVPLPPRGVPFRGEGDVNGNNHRGGGATGGGAYGFPARTKKRGVHK